MVVLFWRNLITRIKCIKQLGWNAWKWKLLEAASEFDNIDIVETEKPQVLKKLILKRN